METNVASGAVVNVEGSFGLGEYEEFMQLKAELKQRRVEDRVKNLGNNRVIWSQRMVMRRVDVKALVPDEDLVAYGEIYKLKNPNEDSKLKTFVADNEIAAYKVLDPDFKGNITLDAISAKVVELVKSGDLAKQGDHELEGEESGDE